MAPSTCGTTQRRVGTGLLADHFIFHSDTSFYTVAGLLLLSTAVMEDLHTMEHALSDATPLIGQKPHLLTLLGELKNRIYRLVTVSTSPVEIWSTTHHPVPSPPYGASITETPALMRTCKQLRHEVHKIYFEENTFAFMYSTIQPNAIETFERMAEASAKKITSIEVKHRTPFRALQSVDFTATLEPSRDGHGLIVETRNRVEKREHGNTIWRALLDRKDCQCNVLEIERQYKNPALTAWHDGGALLAFLRDYAKTAQPYRRGRATIYAFSPAPQPCNGCGKRRLIPEA